MMIAVIIKKIKSEDIGFVKVKKKKALNSLNSVILKAK